MPCVRQPLDQLLASLDEDTRARWADLLERVDAEIREQGPEALRVHLDAALRHLLAIGWTLHRCYAHDESAPLMAPLGAAACTVEELRCTLDLLARRPEWRQ
jgi:hypothetical protein